VSVVDEAVNSRGGGGGEGYEYGQRVGCVGENESPGTELDEKCPVEMSNDGMRKLVRKVWTERSLLCVCLRLSGRKKETARVVLDKWRKDLGREKDEECVCSEDNAGFADEEVD
jgi:hypothetical protein